MNKQDWGWAIQWAHDSASYLWVFILSIWGGLISYFTRLKSGVIEKYSTKSLLVEIASSAFSGVITFYLCSAAHFGDFLTASLVGVAGHMGSRLLAELEKTLLNWLRHKFH